MRTVPSTTWGPPDLQDQIPQNPPKRPITSERIENSSKKQKTTGDRSFSSYQTPPTGINLFPYLRLPDKHILLSPLQAPPSSPSGATEGDSSPHPNSPLNVERDDMDVEAASTSSDHENEDSIEVEQLPVSPLTPPPKAPTPALPVSGHPLIF